MATRRSALSTAELVTQLLQATVLNRRTGERRPITQREVARKLKVDPRTVRKYKSGEIQNAKAETQKRMVSEARSVARSIRSQNERELSRTGKAAPLPEAPVLPMGSRRALRIYQRGKDTGAYRFSDWVNYDVHSLRRQDVRAFVRALRDQKATIQMIFKAPKGDPTISGAARQRADDGESEYVRSGSTIEYLAGRSDTEIEMLLDATLYAPDRAALYVAVLDQGASMGRTARQERGAATRKKSKKRRR